MESGRVKVNQQKKQYEFEIKRAKVFCHAMIENLDKNIGKIVQYLKNTGQYDNTVIVFTSDNGTSEPFEMDQFKYVNGVNLADAKQFVSSKYSKQ